MTLRPTLFLTLLLCATLLASCDSPQTLPTAGSPPPITPSPQYPYWTPPQTATWQIQFTGALDTTLPVDIFFLDLFDASLETIADLHARGIRVVCYFSAGTYEDWRPDAASFPASLLGNDLPDWPGERWLDIRDLENLGPLMLSRISLAAQKGCDGVDPDNVDGFTNDTGFSLSAEDQLAYNVFLANAAHQNNLAIGLKNDLLQVVQLAPFFDWALNEQCFFYEECDLLQPFINAGKPVFVIEYELTPQDFCDQANALNFNAIHKNLELDAYLTACR